MDGDKNEEKVGTWILNLSIEDLDRLDGLERARKTKTEESSKINSLKVDGDFLHYLCCKENLCGRKMVRWADFEDWHKKMFCVKHPQQDWSAKAQVH